MTLLPFEEHHEVKVAKGEPYKVAARCSAPGCTRFTDDAHHIVRRSFTATGEYEWWIEYKGVTIGNLTGLCHECHLLITENRASLSWVEEERMFYWVEGVGSGRDDKPIDPQPPIKYVIQNADPGDENDYDWTRDPDDRLDNADQHFDGPASSRKCRECKRPLPKPKDEKTEEARPRRTWSITVPADHRENGAEVLDTLLDQCRDLFSHGESKQVRYFSLVQALALVAQHGDKMVREA